MIWQSNGATLTSKWTAPLPWGETMRADQALEADLKSTAYSWPFTSAEACFCPAATHAAAHAQRRSAHVSSRLLALPSFSDSLAIMRSAAHYLSTQLKPRPARLSGDHVQKGKLGRAVLYEATCCG